MSISNIEKYMNLIFIEEYNPEFIKQSIVFYENGDTENVDANTAIGFIDNYQESIQQGIISINFKFNFPKINKIVNDEYTKIIKGIFE